MHVSVFNCLNYFICFLDEVSFQAVKVLFQVPWTSSGAAQADHKLLQKTERILLP